MKITITNFDAIINQLNSKQIRLDFVRFIEQRYGIQAQSTYRRIRLRLFEEWEKRGLMHCIHEFTGDHSITDVYEWYNSLPENGKSEPDVLSRRMLFYAYMAPNGLSRNTIMKHMQQRDWTQIQIDGWGRAWYYFLKEGK